MAALPLLALLLAGCADDSPTPIAPMDDGRLSWDADQEGWEGRDRVVLVDKMRTPPSFSLGGCLLLSPPLERTEELVWEGTASLEVTADVTLSTGRRIGVQVDEGDIQWLGPATEDASFTVAVSPDQWETAETGPRWTFWNRDALPAGVEPCDLGATVGDERILVTAIRGPA